MKIIQSRSEFLKAAEQYMPKHMASIEKAACLEKGWMAHCRIYGLQPYPPSKSQTEEEEAEAAEFRARARRAAEQYREVCASSPLSSDDLARGWLADVGRDEAGHLR